MTHRAATFAVALALAAAAIGGALAQKAPPPSGGTKAAAAPAPEDLDRALAPVALYPDAILGQVLLSAENPGRVATLSEWLRSQEALKGTALQDAAKAAGFTESYVAIALFPTIVDAMAQNLEATTLVGAAFAADPSPVFASIQRLRKRAQDAGKLKTTPQQEVETRTTPSGQQVIVIEPANPQVMYVPQYNPQTVYTTSSSTVVIQEDDDAEKAVAAGLIGFTAGIALGAAMDNDYYYGPYGYRGGFHMYNDSWDDWADHREDAREDWMDHREDIVDERGDRARTQQEQRSERSQTSQQQRTERTQTRQENRPQGATSATTAGTSAAARGYTRDAGSKPTGERAGTRSDAFSGYSSGKSERAASSRGQSSRSSSKSGGRRR